jgi:hypothetical protein
LAAQDAGPAQDVATGVQRLERSLGFEETRSFADYAARAGYFRCYYTGKLELPDSYEDLRLLQDRAACARLDPARYDIFVYEPEAVARRGTPITASLAEAPVERQAVVIAHEDFHQQKKVGKLPERIAEAASTLIGFLTAAEYARANYGESSALYRKLSGEAALFLDKAHMVNGYHARLSALYKETRSRPAEALARKQALLAEMQARCQAIPAPVSFGACLSAANNAGLAFDATYTWFYPLLYDLHAALGGDLPATVQAIHQAESARSNEKDTASYIRRLIASRTSP